MTKHEISVTVHGNFNNTERFLKSIKSDRYLNCLHEYGRRGVVALAAATPVCTGKTSNSWKYRIEKRRGFAKIVWYNTNENKHVNIALLLQYGHATYRGGYVVGIDYINPALKPVFDDLARRAWKEVTGT